MTAVIREDRDGVAVLTLVNPPVNALGFDVRDGLGGHLKDVLADGAVQAVIVKGDGRCFCAGADIREFGKPPRSPMLRDVIDTLEGAEKPTIAAIHGQALGGGLELALGCHYRITAADAQLGLPEVKLGIIPGAGGTQRLPRLIGIEKAAEMISSGAPVSGQEAVELGVADALAGDDLLADALGFTKKLLADGKGPRPVRDLNVIQPDAAAMTALEKKITRRARGLSAPPAALESVANAATMDFDAAMKREREIFERLRDSDEAAAQRHLFFATREAAKLADVPRETPARPVKIAAVIGCGTMGAGIAVCLADAGLYVRVLENEGGALAAGIERIKGLYQAQVDRGRIASQTKHDRLSRIIGTVDYADLADVDLVIEAAFEDVEVKRDIFAKLDAVAKPGAVLATNTSTLDIDAVAEATNRPQDIVGMHFFSPAHIMKLLENVRGSKTAPDVLKTVMDIGKRIGKVPVMVGNADGFVGNRMYHRYTRQAYFVVEEGATPDQVDRVFRDFGFAMGPFAVGDMSGLDIAYAVRQRQKESWPEGERYPILADRVVEAGRLGRKSGAGWYSYPDGAKGPEADPALKPLLESASKEAGLERRPVDDMEIHERCFYALINEGAKLLDEGVAARASDIDVVWINGYGFPMKHGGPMHYADRVGLGLIRDRLAHWAEMRSIALKPAPLLDRLADQGGTFASL